MGALTDYSKIQKSWAATYMTISMNSYEKKPDYKLGIWTSSETDNIEDAEVEISGIEDYEEWLENQEAKKTKLEESFVTKYRQKFYAEEIMIGRLEAKFIQQKEQINKERSKQLGYKGYKVQQVLPWRLLARGFDATFLNGYGDLKPTFSTLHPLSSTNAETWSNVDTTSAVVSEEGLENLIVLLDETPETTGEDKNLGDEGFVWMVSNRRDYNAAVRIVDPKANLRPDTGNNDINVFSGKMPGFTNAEVKVVFIPYLKPTFHSEGTTYANAHFLMANGEECLRFITSEAWNIKNYEDEKTAAAYIRASVGFSYGLKTPRGIVASNGSTVTYAG
jgi:hypothetical protein